MASQILQLEHLVTIRGVGPGNWSPDGKSIAFVQAERAGIPYLWVCPAEGGQPLQVSERPVVLEMTDGTDRRDLWGGPQWSPDGTRLLFLSPSEYREQQAGVWSVPIQTAADNEDAHDPAIELTRHVSNDRTPRWSPDGSKIAFVGNRDGRDDIQVAPANEGIALQLTYDRWDNTDLAWSPDSQWIAYISQRSDVDFFANSLCKVPAEGGPVVQLTAGEYDNDRSPRWSPDGESIAFVSNRDDNDDIWLIDAEGGNMRQLTSGNGEKADPQWSPDGRWIAYTHYLHGDINIYVIPAVGGEPRLVVAGGVNDAPRWSPDETRLLYRHTGPGEPPDLWVKDVMTGSEDRGQRLTFSDQGMLAEMDFGEPEVVTYQSKDGLSIESLLYRPPNRTDNTLAKAAPAIVWVHGGPNAVHANGWHDILQFLVQRGYVVIAPNNRGSTGYGKAFMESNISGKAGGDVDDWVAAAELLRTLPEVDGERIAIMGRSAGGYATLLALGHTPEVFQAGVAIAAPSHWPSYWEETQISWTRRFRMKLMGLLSANQELYTRRSPITDAASFQSPVLIIHGDADPGVPSGQARRMAAALEAHGKVYECHIYPGEGHAFSGPTILDSTQRIEAFLAQYLGG